ncbi:MAG: competence/damage-inducible protein A [Gaiellaceae bacterium MAG52_C11]|nr:competence/damage-inducible protein A [Candidatus Gaiellasilicea maunaloa]
MSRRRPRAVVVVTGSELVRGERTDLNGPFLARSLLALGLEPARIEIVGDDPAELEAAVRDAIAGAELVAISGGLGPTHDDRTVEVVARVAGLELELRPELEAEIETVSRRVAERMRRDYTDFAGGVRKQATVPAGALSLGLAGTAPGLVIGVGGTPVVVLPGPPPELQRLWPNALATPLVRHVLDGGRPPLRRTLRLFGAGESMVAQAFAQAGGDGDGVETTICARDFEVVVEVLSEPDAEKRAEELTAALGSRLERFLYSDDGRTVEQVVLDLCREQDLTLGTAESCTGGLIVARLTAVPGFSETTLGGIVAYSNELKERELGVPAALIAEHGAVSAEVAEAMARGARARLGVDVAVAVTGVAGPGGGTEEKPVGLVYFHAVTPGGEKGSSLSFPGDRDSIRRRSVVAALHLVRRVLTQSRDKAAWLGG